VLGFVVSVDKDIFIQTVQSVSDQAESDHYQNEAGEYEQGIPGDKARYADGEQRYPQPPADSLPLFLLARDSITIHLKDHGEKREQQ
jgi:hypothetical protein